MFTLNGLLDIFSKNITTSVLDQLPDADVLITSNKDSYIYNYTNIISSIEHKDSMITEINSTINCIARGYPCNH